MSAAEGRREGHLHFVSIPAAAAAVTDFVSLPPMISRMGVVYDQYSRSEVGWGRRRGGGRTHRHQRAKEWPRSVRLLPGPGCSESDYEAVPLPRNLFQKRLRDREIPRARRGGWAGREGKDSEPDFISLPANATHPTPFLGTSFSPSLPQFATDHGRIGIFCFAQREWLASGSGFGL